MVLVDTSIWIDHLRKNDEHLTVLLNANQVLMHPFVVGEIALGFLKNRESLLQLLKQLPQATTATDEEVMAHISTEPLFGLGIGYIDAHLLASVRITPAAKLWTRDKRLASICPEHLRYTAGLH